LRKLQLIFRQMLIDYHDGNRLFIQVGNDEVMYLEFQFTESRMKQDSLKFQQA